MMNGRANGRSVTNGTDKPLGVGDLPPATPLSDSDTLPICQSPSGCFAADASVTLHGGRLSQLATYTQSKFFGVAPIIYNPATGNFGLAIDPATLAIVGGRLTVIGGGPPPTPGAPPVTGGGGAPEVGGGGAPVTGGGTGVLLARIAELETRLAALEGTK